MTTNNQSGDAGFPPNTFSLSLAGVSELVAEIERLKSQLVEREKDISQSCRLAVEWRERHQRAAEKLKEARYALQRIAEIPLIYSVDWAVDIAREALTK